MPVDQDSLARALEARGRMDRAHREALLARGEFNAAVAALHQAGATLREIAEALDISHQRVHQIVGQEPTFWDRLTRRPPRRRPVAICSFCGRRQHEVARLVAGPGVYICDRCIGLATEVAATGAAQESAAGPTVPIAVEIALRCSFCGKQRRDVTAMVARDDVRICGSCLQLCREVLATDVRRSP